MKIYVVILSTICWSAIYSQSNENSNSKKNSTLLETTESLELALIEAKTNPIKSYNTALKTLKIAEKENDLKTQIIAHKTITICSKLLNKSFEANMHARIAYQILTPKYKYSILGANVVQNFAKCLIQTNNYDYGLKLYLEAENILNEIFKKPHLEKFWNFNEIANIYLKHGDLDKPLEYYQKALTETLNFENKLWIASANNNLGLYYYRLNNIDRALNYYKTAKKQLNLSKVKDGHELFLANINENIAHIYLEYKKQYNNALKIYIETSKIRREFNEVHLAIQSDISILQCHVFLNNHSEIVKYISQIDNYFLNQKTLNQNYVDSNYNKLYKLKLHYYKNNNKIEQYYKTSTIYFNFLTNRFNFQQEINKNAIKEYDKYEQYSFEKELSLKKEIIRETEEINKKRLWLIISVSIIFVLTVLLFLLIINIRKSKQKRTIQEIIITKLELKNIQFEKQKLNEILKTKQKDLVNIVANSTMRVDFLNSILTKMKKVAKKNGAKDIATTIIFDIKSQISIEKRNLALQSDLTKVNVLFKSNLITKFPNLTKLEREICSYIRLNFSVKEISQIRSSSIDSIKMIRSRIRKKLNLNPNTELEKIIQSI